jgi:hypothetical protein
VPGERDAPRRGSPSGERRGLVGVEPTRKRFEVQHIHWHRLRDGQFVDHYAVRDDLGMMSQLGF